MNKIEHAFKWSIESNYLDGFFFNSEDECIRELDIDKASKKCFELLEKISTGFSDWCTLNYGRKYPEKNNLWYPYNGSNIWYKGFTDKEMQSKLWVLTTEELFKIYIEQL